MTSTIPLPTSPDVCSIGVLIDGTEITGEVHVLSAAVSAELNRIPTAALQLRDGEAATQTFAVSDTDRFVPGKEIEIRLGYRGETETVFAGIIVKHRIRVRPDATSLLLECRDKAVRMTSGTKSRCFPDTTDGDLIEELIDGYDLERDVAATTPALRDVVQYDATDWDFLVCRAEANGHVVAVRGGKISVGPPEVGATPVVTTRFGATVLELDAEIDARWQVKGITATAWSAADQQLVEAEAAEPEVPASGDLTATALADVFGGDPHVLRHGGRIGEPELQAWADGRLLKDRLAKIRGRVRFQGFAGITAGDVVNVTGIGTRFAGPQYVTGVRHTFTGGDWTTDAAFGLSPEVHAATYPVTALPAGGRGPTVHGLQIGVVTALVGDPDGEDRIKVRFTVVDPSDEGVWARLATLDAGQDRGTFFRPEIEDEVVVGFLDGDPASPVVLGQVHSSAKPAPEPATDDNHVKGYVSRSTMRFTFDDDTTTVVLETPAGNRLSLSEDAKSVSLADQNGNSVTLDDGGITLTSAKDLVLTATGDVKVEGANVSVTAKAGLKAVSQANAEISAGGVLAVKGSLVRIN